MVGALGLVLVPFFFGCATSAQQIGCVDPRCYVIVVIMNYFLQVQICDVCVEIPIPIGWNEILDENVASHGLNKQQVPAVIY